jgi:hypothetical protein
VDTTHQAMTVAAMYRFLITDYLNPLALSSGGPGSGDMYVVIQVNESLTAEYSSIS